MSSAAHLLTALGASLGMSDLAFDEEGSCTLTFDGLPVTFETDDTTGQLYVFADIGALPVDVPSSTLETLLAANLFWRGAGGATLSLEPDSRHVVVARALPASTLSDIAFLIQVENFVAAAEMWASRLAAPVEAPTDSFDPMLSVPAQWRAV